MDDIDLRAIVGAHIRGALGFDSDQLSARRADNLARYEGDKYGNEKQGRSQVMSRDVMETVEAVMPSLVRTFLGTDQVVQFDPQGPEDEEYAEQATDYVNYCLMQDNEGFRIGQDWMKQALIGSGASVVKVWWDEAEKTREETYSGLTDAQYVDLVNDDSVEVQEHTAFAEAEGQRVEPEEGAVALAIGAPVQAVHDIKIKKTFTKARLRWEALPPEEFLINRQARTLDEDDETFLFCAHRKQRTIDGLKADGYDEDLLDTVANNHDQYLYEAYERHDDLEYNDEAYSDIAPGHRRVWVYECYIKLEGELRKITAIGGDNVTEILDDETVEEIPFADLNAVRLPHRFHGWSLSDLVKDIQLLKTTIWRAMLDGMYQSLFPHKAVNQNTVELDDLLSEAPGGIYRVNGSPGTEIIPIATQWNGAQAFPMMQYIDQVLVSRSGVNDLAGGLDGSALQGETARGVEEAASAAKARIELMARNFAETGWTRLCRLALKMVNRYQDKTRVVRLRGKWVEADPRSWNTDMDVKINVGLGVGGKQEQAAKLQMVMGKQETLMQAMGPNNPIAPLDKYYKTLEALAKVADLEPENHFTDPTEWMEQQKNQPPQPNPEMMKAQSELQMKQAEMQAKAQQAQMEAQMRAESDQQNAQTTAEIERFKAELNAQTDRQKAEMQVAVDRERLAQEQAIALEKMQREYEYRMAELQAEKELEAHKMAAGARDGQGNIDVSD